MDNEFINQFKEIENFANGQYKQQLIKLKEELNLYLFDIKDNVEYKNFFDKISAIISLILSISANKIEKTIQLYESYLRRDEQTIRILYKNLITQKLIRESLDNKIRLLTKNQNEYELIKKKTGAYIKNGQVIYNKQKENEIIILRQENSNLKDMIETYEKLIKEKDILYENLNNKYNSMKRNASKKIVSKKITIPNINISLNNSHNLINTENINHCRINKDKTKKLLNDSYNRKEYSKFNYLKYKNLTKMNNIPFNNCLTARNNLQSSSDNISQKEICLKRLNNSKIKENSKLNINTESQNDISTYRRMPLKINETFILNKKKFNLFEAYTSGSSKKINKFNVSKRLSNYFKKEITSSYYSKKNNSKQNKSSSKNKKIYQNSFEGENMHKSYISSIPYNDYKKSREMTKEINKTKRESESEKNRNEFYCSKNCHKKYCNMDTRKIFLQNNIKKRAFLINSK